MKHVTGYEVVYRRFDATDGLVEKFSMCASKSKRLCEQYMRREADAWIDNGYYCMANTYNYIALTNSQEEIELEILQTMILE